MMNLSPDAIHSLLTSLFPSDYMEDLAHEREVVQRDRKIDIRMLVWTMIVGFAIGGETRSIEGYRRAYNAATDQRICASSFWERFTPALEEFLGDLLDHAVEEVAVPHHVAPAFDRFRTVIATDATVVRLQSFLAEFPATHPDISGLKLYLVHNVVDQSVIAAAITDERTHESTLFETGSWLRGRLFLLDLGFFKYRRFALIDENDGFFISRLKRKTNPTITRPLREWRGRAIPLVGKQVFDVVDDLFREHIDVDVEVEFQRRIYNETRSWDAKRFRVVGVRDSDADDGYRLYMTNLPHEEFDPDQIAALYRARWEVELLFRELKSKYSLGKFQTTKPHIVRIQVLAALLTLVVSRAIMRSFVDRAAECGEEVVFPAERWAATFRSHAQLVLEDLAEGYGFEQPNLAELWYHEAKQPDPSRLGLLEEVSIALYGGLAS